MKKMDSVYIQTAASVLVLVLGLVPAAAYAQDDDSASLGAQTQLQAGDDGVAVHATGQLRVRRSDDGDGSDEQQGSNDRQSGDTREDRKPDGRSGAVREDGDHRNASSTSQDQGEQEENDGAWQIDRAHVSEDASASTTPRDAEHVFNRGQLRAFLNHIVSEDSRIADLHVSSTSVQTDYATTAKLFGAIPSKLTATVTVNSDGSVSVTYPWYAFLFAKHSDELVSQLKSAVGTTSASTTVTASAQAHLIDALFSALKASVQ